MQKQPAPDRLQQFEAVMSADAGRSPAELVSDIAGLSREMGVAAAERLLAAHPHLYAHSDQLTAGFYELAVTAEDTEITRIKALEFDSPTSYSDIMDDAIAATYYRVSDVFDWLDFENCRRFVMIGCGQLPVTALHVCDRFDVAEVICVDIRSDAADDAGYLFERLGNTNLTTVVGSGQDFDYQGTDIVYVANMVIGKDTVVARILETAKRNVQVVVRGPVGLGRLWTEDIVDIAALGMRIAERGHVSRYQSQDRLLARINQREA